MVVSSVCDCPFPTYLVGLAFSEMHSEGSIARWLKVSSKHGLRFWNFFFFFSRLLAARNIQRPQVCFKTPVDNSNKTPFEPRIKYKPNSIKPLAVLPEYDADGNIEGYLHPYETELNKFEVPSSLLKPKEPLRPNRLEDTPLMYVDTVKQLKQLIETELVGVTELAVDLEHHSYRTFQVSQQTTGCAVTVFF